MKRMISTNSMESDQSALYKLKSQYHTFLQYVLETILLISSQNVVSVIDSYQNKILFYKPCHLYRYATKHI